MYARLSIIQQHSKTVMVNGDSAEAGFAMTFQYITFNFKKLHYIQTKFMN